MSNGVGKQPCILAGSMLHPNKIPFNSSHAELLKRKSWKINKFHLNSCDKRTVRTPTDDDRNFTFQFKSTHGQRTQLRLSILEEQLDPNAKTGADLRKNME